MARRNDALPKPKDGVGLRIDILPAVRDDLRDLAGSHGYSMAAFLQLLIVATIREPGWAKKRIPKNRTTSLDTNTAVR